MIRLIAILTARQNLRLVTDFLTYLQTAINAEI